MTSYVVIDILIIVGTWKRCVQIFIPDAAVNITPTNKNMITIDGSKVICDVAEVNRIKVWRINWGYGRPKNDITILKHDRNISFAVCIYLFHILKKY